MKTVEVKTGDTAYAIRIGPGLLGQAGQQLRERGFSGKLVIITNPLVKKLWGKATEDSLQGAGFTITSLEVPDGEEYKSLSTAGKLYHKLNRAYVERTTPIVALGGGVIGDLAGFVAATYMRGVPLVHLPTTLLAQVDSSIGGKVAVNHGRLKNNIGVFYQPRLVISDISALKTLDDAQFRNGMAEVIKSAVVWSEDLFTYLEKNLDRVQSRDEAALEEVISRSARIKAEVVARDEKDLGLRNILNYGHTVGHAIESASAFRLAHGSAVAIGMVAAAQISYQLGVLSRSGLARLSALIQRTGLPAEVPDLDMGRLIRAMRHDKKVTYGKMRFVLLQALGKAFVTEDVSPALVERVLVSRNETTQNLRGDNRQRPGGSEEGRTAG